MTRLFLENGENTMRPRSDRESFESYEGANPVDKFPRDRTDPKVVPHHLVGAQALSMVERDNSSDYPQKSR